MGKQNKKGWDKFNLLVLKSTAKDDVLRKCSPFVCTGNDWKSRRSEIVPTLSNTKVNHFLILDNHYSL